MPKILSWLVEALVFLVLAAILKTPLAKLSVKLGENAVIGWIDDRIGEALGITAPSVSQVVDWGLPLLAAAAVLLIYHWVHVRFFGAPKFEWGPVRNLLLVPKHMVYGGLIIIVIGVVLLSVGLWQQSNEQQKSITDRTRQTSATQIAPPYSIPGHDSNVAIEVEARPQKVPTITTAPADISKKLAAIDNLRAVLSDDMAPWIQRGYELSTNAWWNWAVSNEIPQLKDAFREFWRKADEIDEKLKNLQKQNEFFPDIYALAQSPLGRPFHLKAQDLVTPILALPEQLGNFMDFYRVSVEPVAKETYATLQSLENWRVATDRNALQLRKQISQ